MANTFVKIATVTVGAGGASSMVFSSIPNTYTDLKVVASLRTNKSGNTDSLWIRFNATSTAYSDRNLQGTGSSTSSFSNAASGTAIYSGEIDAALATASAFSNSEIYIPNYTSANYKSSSTDSVEENNATAADILICAGLWSNTAVINQITLLPSTGPNFVQYSTATLYGISKS